MKKILSVFGTRPEAIKMAPVVQEFEKNSDYFDSRVCVTGQHRYMLDQVLDFFDIHPEYDLDIMKSSQSLTDVTSYVLEGMIPVLEDFKPDLVLVHGDTTTAMAASLATYYQRIIVGHVESGLRTGNIYSPWPEEMNRRIVSSIASYHFAPTVQSKNNLLNEGISNNAIVVTGNTVIDALIGVVDQVRTNDHLRQDMEYKFSFLNQNKRLILVTCHRRENSGGGLKSICIALKSIVDVCDDVEIIFPVHLNPKVRKSVYEILEGVQGIHLIEPQEYLSFVFLMNRSYLIITDSGGIQEEAPSLGKPVIVIRDTTERPEAVETGALKLVGTDHDSLIDCVLKLCTDKKAYQYMSNAKNPYGDGMASARIINHLKQVL